MMSAQNKTFEEIFANYVDKLDLYTNAITRAHGSSHPEAFDVRKLFEALNKKVTEQDLNLNDEFAKLREVTNDYKVPGDVCETYAATYEMLSELDKAYKG